MAHEILVVDDEADIRMAISGILADEGYVVREAGDSDSAQEAIRTRRPSLVILDIWLQNSSLDGMDLLQTLIREQPALPIIMISGHGSIEMAVNAIRIGAYEFIEKPFKADRLLLNVQRAIEAAQLKMEVEELRLRAGPAGELIGSSPAITQVRQAVEKVTPTGSRVLITGPAGAGKEVVARLLHICSRRGSGPFIAVNCATMHPVLCVELCRKQLLHPCLVRPMAKTHCRPRRGPSNAAIQARTSCWKASCSARSRMQTSRKVRARSGPSSGHTEAPCCWTKWRTCRLRPRARSSGSSRSSPSSASAGTSRSRWMCG